jgi:hypothetical protein
MPNPTAKEISRAFPQISEEDARELARLMRDTAGGEEEVEDTLEYANTLLRGFGVESLRAEVGPIPGGYWRESQAAFVNMGDPYEATILHDNMKGEYAITSWGDWLEAWELEYRDAEEEERE